MERETTSQKDELITRKEASEILKCSLPSLNAWEKRKDLVPIRFGRRVYYKRSDIFKNSL